MCLQLFALPAQSGKVSARRLAAVSGLSVAKLNEPLPGAMWFSVDGGCSCSLMSDDASFDDLVWDLKPDVLDGLVAAVELLAREAKGLAFYAYWAGEDPGSAHRVKVRELLNDIRSNRVRNKYVYLVGRAA